MQNPCMRVAFLDRYGRFAKQTSDVAEVRVFPGDDPEVYTTITAANYAKLTKAEQDTLKLADSAAGLIDTSTKSNA